MARGSSTTFKFRVIRKNGMTKDVAFTAPYAPAGITTSFDHVAQVGNDDVTMTVNVAAISYCVFAVDTNNPGRSSTASPMSPCYCVFTVYTNNPERRVGVALLLSVRRISSAATGRNPGENRTGYSISDFVRAFAGADRCHSEGTNARAVAGGVRIT